MANVISLKPGLENIGKYGGFDRNNKSCLFCGRSAGFGVFRHLWYRKINNVLLPKDRNSFVKKLECDF